MPLIQDSSFSPARFMHNRHIQTCYPTLFRRVKPISYQRERIGTPDDDFLDLDWSRLGNNRLVVISHGLEGSSNGVYVKGMVKAFNDAQWDALAWNFRGCGGEPNRRIYNYHSGKSEDLASVIEHALMLNYREIALIGFSVGGNITLKYLAECREKLDARLKAAVVFSVPVDLAECALQLERAENSIYLRRFIRMLHEKIREKHNRFPSELDISDLPLLRTFSSFDDRFTAPLNGYKDANEYWSKASSLPLLADLQTPTLMVNAMDDTFLGPNCYPTKLANQHRFLSLEIPKAGGHVGFTDSLRESALWSEKRAIQFLESI